jgi:hypothetical protein
VHKPQEDRAHESLEDNEGHEPQHDNDDEEQSEEHLQSRA